MKVIKLILDSEKEFELKRIPYDPFYQKES